MARYFGITTTFVFKLYAKSCILYKTIDISAVHNDCGMLIFDLEGQDVNSGGSGCGCGASVLCSHIMKKMRNGELKKLLFVATGALMSPTSAKQGQTIPGIAHAVLLSSKVD